MKILRTILIAARQIAVEVILVFLYIVLINNYLGPTSPMIKSDGVGYYDYLPSTFIRHDLNRKHVTPQEDIALYRRVKGRDVYPEYKEFVVNKYACGTALLQLPFFMSAYPYAEFDGSDTDGYQEPFQKRVFYAALFYLVLSLFFLKKLLLIYRVKSYIIFLSQFLLVFATQVLIYAQYDASFSHIYSLFAVSAFLYFTKSYFTKSKITESRSSKSYLTESNITESDPDSYNVRDFLIASIFFGLILILRQINILIILIVPFLAGSWKNLKEGVLHIFRKPVWLFASLASVIAIFFIQSIAWYLQTGEFLIYTYGNEPGFNFLDPKFFKVLFSYRSGLFVYTPLAFILLLSTLWLIYQKKSFLFLSWISFFILLTYVLSSWYSWVYGASYGLRAYLEYYPVLFIPFAVFLNEAPAKLKTTALVLSLIAVPLNIIQSYQYKHGIFQWTEMDKENYWKVFLRTEDKYRWILWKEHRNIDSNHILKEISVGDFDISAGKQDLIYQVESSAIPNFSKVNIVEVLIDHHFPKREDTHIFLSITNSENEEDLYYWQNTPLIHFAEKNFNIPQTGLLDYTFSPVPDDGNRIMKLVVNTGKNDISLKNVRLRFIHYN